MTIGPPRAGVKVVPEINCKRLRPFSSRRLSPLGPGDSDTAPRACGVNMPAGAFLLDPICSVISLLHHIEFTH